MDLSSFERRAKEAEDIIEELSKRISVLEQQALEKKNQQITVTSNDDSTASVPLATYEKLLKENDKLKQEVEKQNYRITHLLRNMK